MSHPQQQPFPRRTPRGRSRRTTVAGAGPCWPSASQSSACSPSCSPGGKLQLTNIFLALPSRKAAQAAAIGDKISESDFVVRDESFLPGYAIGSTARTPAAPGS